MAYKFHYSNHLFARLVFVICYLKIKPFFIRLALPIRSSNSVCHIEIRCSKRMTFIKDFASSYTLGKANKIIFQNDNIAYDKVITMTSQGFYIQRTVLIQKNYRRNTKFVLTEVLSEPSKPLGASPLALPFPITGCASSVCSMFIL